MNEKIKKHFPRFIAVFFTVSPILALKLFVIPFLTMNKPKYDWYAYKHKVILSFLKKRMKKTINIYKDKQNDVIPFKEKFPIWVFWWQGIEDMPLIIKKCYRTLEQFSNGHKVNLVTKINYKKYITIPDYILIKAEKKELSITHLTDIIRVCLLYEHGGLWLDSTVLLTKPITEIPLICTHLGFWTPKDNGEILETCFGTSNWIVRENKWLTFCFYQSKNNILTEILRSLFFVYVKYFKYFIDYFLFDYFFAIAYEINNDVRVMIDSVPVNNPKIHEIQHRLNLNYRYNKELFDNICKDTFFHKLSWKENYKEYTNNNELTNYGYIINNYPPKE